MTDSNIYGWVLRMAATHLLATSYVGSAEIQTWIYPDLVSTVMEENIAELEASDGKKERQQKLEHFTQT